jgi:hypothetical protein
MDQIDLTQNETAPPTSRERPLPTRFGRGNRAAELAGRREHAPGRRSDTERPAAVEVVDDDSIFEDRGGL